MKERILELIDEYENIVLINCVKRNGRDRIGLPIIYYDKKQEFWSFNYDPQKPNGKYFIASTLMFRSRVFGKDIKIKIDGLVI